VMKASRCSRRTISIETRLMERRAGLSARPARLGPTESRCRSKQRYACLRAFRARRRDRARGLGRRGARVGRDSRLRHGGPRSRPACVPSGPLLYEATRALQARVLAARQGSGARRDRHQGALPGRSPAGDLRCHDALAPAVRATAPADHSSEAFPRHAELPLRRRDPLTRMARQAESPRAKARA